jgi:hypothetical protein
MAVLGRAPFLEFACAAYCSDTVLLVCLPTSLKLRRIDRHIRSMFPMRSMAGPIAMHPALPVNLAIEKGMNWR